MFDFADMTENGVFRWNIQFTSCFFYPLAIVIQEIHKKEGNEKHEWNNQLFF